MPMSATQPSTSTVPSPSTTPSTTNAASTLLFGFLVSALTFFAVFMTFAIVWNRLIARRHAIDAMLEMSTPLASQQLHRPPMWDIWVMPDKQPPPWLDIKPVAVQKCDYPASSPRTTVTHPEQTIPFWRRHPLSRVPPEITYLFHPPIPPAPSPSSDVDICLPGLSHTSDIQVSLLIAMPSAPLSQEGIHENHQTSHEIVLATTNIRYHDPVSS